jgi:hypothetical protein
MKRIAMKKLIFLLPLLLSGCVSIEMPGLVSDVVKAAKDLYAGTSADRTQVAKPAATASRQPVLAHSYVGKVSETQAEIKHVCVAEAAQMLRVITGKEMSYSVLREEIVMLDKTAIANCELAVDG